MKHKKAMVYGLGFLVVCIWGLIILRIFSAVGDKDADLPEDRNSRLAPKVEVPVLQPDTFQLQLNYPDPFLKSDQKEVIAAPLVGTPMPMNGNNFMPKPAAPVVKPVVIQYLGYIASTGGKQKIAIMNQDGKERMMTEGQLTDQLQLLKIGSDSVKIKYKGKTSFIRINK
jgi:hypothetical protein